MAVRVRESTRERQRETERDRESQRESERVQKWEEKEKEKEYSTVPNVLYIFSENDGCGSRFKSDLKKVLKNEFLGIFWPWGSPSNQLI